MNKTATKPRPPLRNCPLCKDRVLRLKADELYAMGHTDQEVSDAVGLKADIVLRHYESCVPALAEQARQAEILDAKRVEVERREQERQRVLDDLRLPVQSDEMVDGRDIVQKMFDYNRKIDTLIGLDDKQLSIKDRLAALDLARKVCADIARIYLDVLKAQIDANVQAQFRNIVVEEINAAAPDVRERIVERLRASAELHGALGAVGR